MPDTSERGLRQTNDQLRLDAKRNEREAGPRRPLSVQGSRAMFAISRSGSDRHEQQRLPLMAAGQAVGCLGLTEPDSGSEPASIRTRAHRESGSWALSLRTPIGSRWRAGAGCQNTAAIRAAA
jgi:hypothetical protein